MFWASKKAPFRDISCWVLALACSWLWIGRSSQRWEFLGHWALKTFRVCRMLRLRLAQSQHAKTSPRALCMGQILESTWSLMSHWVCNYLQLLPNLLCLSRHVGAIHFATRLKILKWCSEKRSSGGLLDSLSRGLSQISYWALLYAVLVMRQSSCCANRPPFTIALNPTGIRLNPTTSILTAHDSLGLLAHQHLLWMAFESSKRCKRQLSSTRSHKNIRNDTKCYKIMQGPFKYHIFCATVQHMLYWKIEVCWDCSGWPGESSWVTKVASCEADRCSSSS